MNERRDSSVFAQQDAARRARRRAWFLAVGLGLIVFGAVTAELASRMVLGLGDPPLYQTHPTIEYMLQPSRTSTRFGNRISINRYSMRSPDFEPAKKSGEFRVLVIGDSVPFGGSRVDDASLATSMLQRLLRERTGREVIVGNASAGSWGPPNMLAYLREFGTLEADVVVMLLNSDDASDVPTFGPLGSDMPTQTPMFALQEAVSRYLPRYLAALSGPGTELPPVMNPQDVAKATQAVRQMTTLIRESKAQPVAVLYWRRSEIQDLARAGLSTLRGELTQLGVPTVESRDAFKTELDAATAVYADDIHPTTLGQSVLAGVLASAVEKVVEMAPLPQPPPIDVGDSPQIRPEMDPDSDPDAAPPASEPPATLPKEDRGSARGQTR